MRGSVGTWLIVAGLALLLAGVFVKAGMLSWFGQLPGDVRFERGNTRVYFPLTSMILVSVALSLFVSLVRRFLG